MTVKGSLKFEDLISLDEDKEGVLRREVLLKLIHLDSTDRASVLKMMEALVEASITSKPLN
jgi:hypothetical protein|tara:strand:+ start:4040 stop:4222 length:183 start_codon:yes stop_codon:yes gene_type:complete